MEIFLKKADWHESLEVLTHDGFEVLCALLEKHDHIKKLKELKTRYAELLIKTKLFAFNEKPYVDKNSKLYCGPEIDQEIPCRSFEVASLGDGLAYELNVNWIVDLSGNESSNNDECLIKRSEWQIKGIRNKLILLAKFIEEAGGTVDKSDVYEKFSRHISAILGDNAKLKDIEWCKKFICVDNEKGTVSLVTDHRNKSVKIP